MAAAPGDKKEAVPGGNAPLPCCERDSVPRSRCVRAFRSPLFCCGAVVLLGAVVFVALFLAGVRPGHAAIVSVVILCCAGKVMFVVHGCCKRASLAGGSSKGSRRRTGPASAQPPETGAYGQETSI